MPEPRKRASAGVSGPIAVVAAMPEELAPLGRRLAGAEKTSDQPPFVTGRLAGVEVVLGVTGVGRAQAERGLTRLLETQRPAAVLVIGLAAGLRADLDVGDVILASEVRDGAKRSPTLLAGPDPHWLTAVGRAGQVVTGPVVSVDEILTSPAAKKRWSRGADSEGAVGADMESAALARVAAGRGLPYLVLRAVSDRLDESLPSFLAGCRGEEGGIDRRRVIARALPRPSSWPFLLRLRSRMSRCAARLADLAETAIASAPTGAEHGPS